MKFWTLVTLIIFVPIYILALILVKEGVEGSLEPFILLNIGALSIPGFLKLLFSKHDDEQSKEKKKELFRQVYAYRNHLNFCLKHRFVDDESQV